MVHIVAAKLQEILAATYISPPKRESGLPKRELWNLKKWMVVTQPGKTGTEPDLLAYKVFDRQAVLQAAGQGHFIGIFQFAAKGNAS